MENRHVTRCVALMTGNGAALLLVFNYLYDFARVEAGISPPYNTVYLAILVSLTGIVSAFCALYFEPRNGIGRALEVVAGATFLLIILGWLSTSTRVLMF